MKTLVFIPTYNESGNVERLCEEILALKLDLDLLFMDDNSPDGTGEIIDRLAKKHPNVAALHRPGKLGVGGAHLEGIAWAYDRGYKRLITMDCDFTHSPAYIPEFMRQGEIYDLVVGSRHALKTSLEGWDPFRKLLTKSGYFFTRHVLGIRYDATGAYRHYRLDRIPRALFLLVHEKQYAFFFESMFVFQANDYSIKEIAIVLPARVRGHSKMSFRLMARSVYQLFKMAAVSSIYRERYRLTSEPEND